MALSLVTGPTKEPITLAEAKAHLRVDYATDDAKIAACITAARGALETFTRRKFMPQTWDLFTDGLPSRAVNYGTLELPFAPLQSITYVKYLDMAGVLQTWTPTNQYEFDAPAGPAAMPGRLMPVYLGFWPVVRPSLNAFRVRFVCGYAPGAAVSVSSMTQAAGVATVNTATAHGYRAAETVPLAGAAQAGYVGDFPVLAVLSATAFTVAVDAGTATPATGTITAQSLGFPEELKQAMLLTIGHLYENRQDVVTLDGGQQIAELPQGAEFLAWPFRVLDWGA